MQGFWSVLTETKQNWFAALEKAGIIHAMQFTTGNKKAPDYQRPGLFLKQKVFRTGWPH